MCIQKYRNLLNNHGQRQLKKNSILTVVVSRLIVVPTAKKIRWSSLLSRMAIWLYSPRRSSPPRRGFPTFRKGTEDTSPLEKTRSHSTRNQHTNWRYSKEHAYTGWSSLILFMFALCFALRLLGSFPVPKNVISGRAEDFEEDKSSRRTPRDSSSSTEAGPPPPTIVDGGSRVSLPKLPGKTYTTQQLEQDPGMWWKPDRGGVGAQLLPPLQSVRWSAGAVFSFEGNRSRRGQSGTARFCIYYKKRSSWVVPLFCPRVVSWSTSLPLVHIGVCAGGGSRQLNNEQRGEMGGVA